MLNIGFKADINSCLVNFFKSEICIQRWKKINPFFIILICSSITLNFLPPAFADRGVQQVAVKTGEGKIIPLYQSSYALVVGNGNYINGWSTLPGALRDVVDVEQALTKNGFVVIRKDNLTKTEFEKVFSDFVQNYGSDKQNRLLFYYAGHGFTEKTVNNEDFGYLVMTDAPVYDKNNQSAFRIKSIDMQFLINQAKLIRSRHVLFMFDSCFSGSILNMRNQIMPEHIKESIKFPVRQFITAGRADEQVPDYSYFKKEFINLLEGLGDEPVPDGFVTGSELGLYLKMQVPKYNPGQHPQYGTIREPDLDKGDFVFLVTRNKITLPKKTEEDLGSLIIETKPSGASIIIDGIFKGISPLIINDLPSGNVRVRSVAERYKPEEQVVRVSGDKTNRLTLVLQQQYIGGLLSVGTTPSGANWYLDDAYIGITPDVLKGLTDGEHIVTFRKEGYQEKKESVYVSNQEKIVLQGILEPKLMASFLKGSREVWSANFSQWPSMNYPYGNAIPVPGGYELEAFNNTIVGPGRLMPITQLNGDFIINYLFKILYSANTTGIGVSLSGDGREDFALSINLNISAPTGEGVFSIEDMKITKFNYWNINKSISRYQPIPSTITSDMNWRNLNKLSIKREGQNISIFLNDKLLKLFQATYFSPKKVGISLSQNSKLFVSTLNAKAPIL